MHIYICMFFFQKHTYNYMCSVFIYIYIQGQSIAARKRPFPKKKWWLEGGSSFLSFWGMVTFQWLWVKHQGLFPPKIYLADGGTKKLMRCTWFSSKGGMFRWKSLFKPFMYHPGLKSNDFWPPKLRIVRMVTKHRKNSASRVVRQLSIQSGRSRLMFVWKAVVVTLVFLRNLRKPPHWQ